MRRRWPIGLIVPVVLIGAWQAIGSAGWVNPHALPSPLPVVHKWWEYLVSGELVGDALGSLYRVVVGFLVGAGLALPLGLVMGASERLHKLLDPMLQVLRPIPPIAYIPLAILWFGLGNPPAIF